CLSERSVQKSDGLHGFGFLYLCGANQVADSCRPLQYSNFLIFCKKNRGSLRGRPRLESTRKRSLSPFYPRFIHNDHLEVFDKFNDLNVVLNLDGSVNKAKTKKARAEKRKLNE
ncbi:hypothetical protein, partial [Pseudomonas sp. NPDC087615]|uniref:hypothetical protein n=1 Tax=Pseudomonas sp. NPDC087615 TaxID=3364443 RepID=UPI0037F36EDE